MFMKDFTRAATITPAIAAARPLSGLLAETLVETASGWRTAESLRIGDSLPNAEGGTARVTGIDRRDIAPGTPALLLPGGLFDACSDLVLLPGQHLMLDTLGDPNLPDALAVLVPAAALAHCPGVRQIALHRAQSITPLFREEEVIWAHSGVMLHCPALTDGAQSQPDSGFFPRLSPLAARAFLYRRLALAA